MLEILYLFASGVAAFFFLYAHLLTNARGSWCRHLRKLGRLAVFAGCLMGIAAVMQDGWDPHWSEVVLMGGLAVLGYLQAKTDIEQAQQRRLMGVQQERRS